MSAQQAMGKDARIVYLHHSTGNRIWQGGVPEWFEKNNSKNGTSYRITEQTFPKDESYGWNNYPYDYWNIWVNNAGEAPFKDEPTIEMLVKDYDVVVFKHCFPVANVLEDTGKPDISSTTKAAENYKLHYEALKTKMKSFPNTRFVVWTGALKAESKTNPEDATRAKAFFDWVKNEWDEAGDNVFVWDFAALEGEGGLYLKEEYEAKPGDSHPSEEFARRAAPLCGQRMVDIIEGRGDTGSLTGAK